MNMVFNKYIECIHNYQPIKYIGEVVRVSGLIVESIGPRVKLGEICVIETADGDVLSEVVAFKKDRVFLMAYSYDIKSIYSGAKVVGSGSSLKIPVCDQLLGRVLNGIAMPIDGKEEIFSSVFCSPNSDSPAPFDRKRIKVPISTGVKVLDGLFTVGEGQRMGVFAGTGVGKSTFLGMVARNSSADVNVIVLIGERGRELVDFIEKDLGEKGMKKSVIIAATADSSALMRIKAAFVAMSIAEYFRDKGKNVVLIMDSITRFARAQRELGLAIGEPPTTKGYPPSVFALMPQLLERAGATYSGSITGFYSVLVEGDDINDPVADNIKGVIDGHIVLSRKLSEKRYYPAVDISASISRLAVDMLSRECIEIMNEINNIIAVYKESEDLILVGAYVKGSNSRLDYAISMIDRIRKLFRQDVDQSFPLEKTFELMFSLFSRNFNFKKYLPSYYARNVNKNLL